jgi:hypothetical protein
VEPIRNIVIVKAWRTALQVRNFRIKISIAALLLAGCALAAPVLFKFIQYRQGVVLNDYILSVLPSLDLSNWIFLILYVLILFSIYTLLADPHHFLLTLQAYIILTIFRFITLLVTPLEPPENISVLSDPLVDYLFYQEPTPITKDLFFSGHTAILVLFALSLPSVVSRMVLSIGASAVGVMLLVQHAHYTVDVLAAPLFAWGALQLAKVAFKPV